MTGVDLAILLAVGVPAIVVLMLARSAVSEATDAVAGRVRSHPEVARRAPYHRALWKLGGVITTLPLILLAVGVRGADAGQWRTIGLLSAALLALGGLFFAAWWLLAGRALRREARARRT